MACIALPDTGVLRSVVLTGASDRLDFQCIEEPTALFRWRLYLRRVAGSNLLSCPFALT